jgi:hypothetical protein
MKLRGKDNRIPNNETNKMDVALFIGDSNQLGVGTMTDPNSVPPAPDYDGPYPNVYIWAKNSPAAIDNGSLELLEHGVNEFPSRGFNNTVFSSTMASGYRWGLDSGNPVCMIKWGISGSTLVTNTTPYDYSTGLYGSWTVSPEGDNLAMFRDYVYTPAINAITALGYTPTIKAVFIRLGTNDSNVSIYNRDQFQNQVAQLVSFLRTLTSNPKLQVYWYKVRVDLASGTFPAGNITVINAKLLACATLGDPSYIEGFNLIDLGTNAADLKSDGVHFTPNAYATQGLAEGVILESLY